MNLKEVRRLGGSLDAELGAGLVVRMEFEEALGSTLELGDALGDLDG